MSLSGKEVGYGLITSYELVSRIGDASKLIGRIVERQRDSSFTERGLRRTTRETFPVLVSVPRAASFAVTLKVGRPTGQLILPAEIEVIVDEFMDLMEMVNSSDIRALQERIPEPAYLRNFLGLAKKLAPDGDRVRQVGFTVERGSGERRVSVTTPATEIPLPPVVELATEDETPGKPVEVRGMLRFADATGDEANIIKIVNDKGRRRSGESARGHDERYRTSNVGFEGSRKGITKGPIHSLARHRLRRANRIMNLSRDGTAGVNTAAIPPMAVESRTATASGPSASRVVLQMAGPAGSGLEV